MQLTTAETGPASDDSGLASVDLVLNLIELLARSDRSRAMSDIARELGISKPRAHRHLRALILHGYARQDPETERYEIGIKVLALGEIVRDRFDVMTAARPELGRLRDETGQTVTVSALVDNAIVVLDLLPGKTLVEFGIRPGSTLDFHASAHGLVGLAYGPARLMQTVLARPLKAWTSATVTDPAKLAQDVETVRQRGWATAADRLLLGVNALAAPIFDYRNEWRGTIAIVGSTQFIDAEPSARQLALVVEAAAESSRRLGWKGILP